MLTEAEKAQIRALHPVNTDIHIRLAENNPRIAALYRLSPEQRRQLYQDRLRGEELGIRITPT